MTSNSIEHAGRARRLLQAVARAYIESAPFYLHFLAVGPVFTTPDRRTIK
ncbi:MAG: hypothetical protein H0W01_03620 [Pseudonocardiales bacterium]|nr:hypothetical protein [Pseudonocardiales bacterium]